MPQIHPLQTLLEPIVTKLGYELVRVLTIGQKNPTLQIMIDRLDGSNITVDDCATVSRAVSDILDEKDPIEGQYSLEVSSPGLDRPLTKLEHFQRYNGYEAKIETSCEVEGRKRFKGKLSGVESNGLVHINMNDQDYAIPFADINKAKLVITDELLAAAAEAQEIEL